MWYFCCHGKELYKCSQRQPLLRQQFKESQKISVTLEIQKAGVGCATEISHMWEYEVYQESPYTDSPVVREMSQRLLHVLLF